MVKARIFRSWTRSSSVQWQPTKQGYLNFLAESKILYDTIESIVAESSHPEGAFPSIIYVLNFQIATPINITSACVALNGKSHLICVTEASENWFWTIESF